MILPATYATALALTILSMLCWGSWANSFKLTRKWRFELFYFDYAFGLLVAALIAALTFGSMGDELSFLDNLMYTAGKRQIAWAFAGGVVFNLGNILLVAAISICGLAVAFPIGIGLAFIIGLISSYVLKPAGNPVLLFSGAALVVGAIAIDALAYRAHAQQAATRKTRFSVKGLILSLASGILMGPFYPLVEMANVADSGLGPYTLVVVFAIGVLLSTFFFNLYFMNLPVQGLPIPITAYFAPKSLRNHLLGWGGGAVWCAGAVANFVAASAPAEANLGPAVSYAVGQGAMLIGALWGLLVWKEFAGAVKRVKVLLAIMVILLAAGLTLMSIAPRY